MAGAMRKMAVYLGLVEDDDRDYDDYDYDYDGHDPRSGHSGHSGHERGIHPVRDDHREGAAGPLAGRGERRSPVASAMPMPAVSGHDGYRITTLHPRTYNEARQIGEHFREGTPVIMNLTEMDDVDAKRLVDFAAGLVFGLHGTIERVTNKVFLLSPANVHVTAEDKARIAENGFFNQS
jgi:cell division inhibitor SepF